MGFFKKKKENLTYVLKTERIDLVLDRNRFDPENIQTIPCILLADTELLRIVNGQEPYKLYLSPSGPYYSTQPPTFTVSGTHIKEGLPFTSKTLETIAIGLPIREVVTTLLKTGPRTIVFTLSIEDEVGARCILTLTVFTNILVEQLSAFIHEDLFLKDPVLDFSGTSENPTLALLFPQPLILTTFEQNFLLLFTFEKDVPLKKTILTQAATEPAFRNDVAEYLSRKNLTAGMTYSILTKIPLAATVLKPYTLDDFHQLLHIDKIQGTLTLQTAQGTISKPFDLIIPKGLLINKYFSDYHQWDENNLIAVSAIMQSDYSKFVEKKTFGPRVMYGSPYKPSIHFSLNHIVTSHLYGNWEKTDRVVLIPLKDLLAINKQTTYGGITVDFFFVGYVKLPNTTRIIDRNQGETWEAFVERINFIITYKLGFKVTEGGMWAWGGSWDVTRWWNKLCEKKGWWAGPHSSSHLGEIASMRSKPKGSAEQKEFREFQLQELQKHYPELYKEYKKPLNAWKSFWNIKNNI